MLATPEGIMTLRRDFYSKAKQKPAYRLYALYDKVWRADILNHDYRMVCANNGRPGVDRVSFEAIEQTNRGIACEKRTVQGGGLVLHACYQTLFSAQKIGKEQVGSLQQSKFEPLHSPETYPNQINFSQCDCLAQTKEIDEFLSGLAHDLKEKTYHSGAGAVRRVMISKADGSQHPLGIRTIRDRAAQMAVKLVIDRSSKPTSVRTPMGPGRRIRPTMPWMKSLKWLHRGNTPVIDADLSKYFDSIPQAELITVVAGRIVDDAILHPIKQWLKAPVIGEGEDGKRKNVGGGQANRTGTPQGGVISPLLSNGRLHLLDRIWARHPLVGRLKTRLVRHVDDFVMLCGGKADASLAMVRRVPDRLELAINKSKTCLINVREESFNFLGFSIRVSKSWKSGTSYAHVCPERESLAKIKESVRQKMDRRLTPIPLSDVVKNLDVSLRGWMDCFHYPDSSRVSIK